MPLPDTREELTADLKATVAAVMDIDEAKIQGTTRFVEDLGMESLMALEIMVALERKYGVKLKEEELRQMSCLNAVVGLMEKRREVASA